jgi:hypothetical protein
MGLLDKAKNVAEQATTKAKEGAEELKTRRELGASYDELGKLAFELAESGELTHPRLTETVEKIRRLRAELAEGDGHAETTPVASGPPAMPT